MILGAIGAVALPLMSKGRKALTVSLGLVILVSVLGLYPLASNYIVRSDAYNAMASATTEEAARAAAASLAAELERSPDDYAGWRLLGQGYLELGDFDNAANALTRALDISEYRDPQLKVMLGEALTYANGEGFPPGAIRLFIEAYNEAPDNPRAQWYAGLAFAANNEPLKAADAWEAMLQQNPPEDVAVILRERVAALRGQTAAVSTGAVSLLLTLNAQLAGELPESARLYVSVRDADAGGPPLAARQYLPSSLPLEVQLDDRDAMVAGRTISTATNVLITARISMNGDPLGASGDFIGRKTVALASLDGPLSLQIAEVVE